MTALLHSARQNSVKVWAVRSDITTRTILRERGYKWNDGSDSRPKSWWKCIKEIELASEREWLRENVYCGNNRTFLVQRFNGLLKYSRRIDDLPLLQVDVEKEISEVRRCS